MTLLNATGRERIIEMCAPSPTTRAVTVTRSSKSSTPDNSRPTSNKHTPFNAHAVVSYATQVAWQSRPKGHHKTPTHATRGRDRTVCIRHPRKLALMDLDTPAKGWRSCVVTANGKLFHPVHRRAARSAEVRRRGLERPAGQPPRPRQSPPSAAAPEPSRNKRNRRHKNVREEVEVWGKTSSRTRLLHGTSQRTPTKLHDDNMGARVCRCLVMRARRCRAVGVG